MKHRSYAGLDQLGPPPRKVHDDYSDYLALSRPHVVSIAGRQAQSAGKRKVKITLPSIKSCAPERITEEGMS